jgi:DNA-binding NtrC family response regulator
MSDTTDRRGWHERRDEFERDLINEALAECGGSVRRAARRLKLSPTGLYKRMRAVGVPLPSSEQGQVDDEPNEG